MRKDGRRGAFLLAGRVFNIVGREKEVPDLSDGGLLIGKGLPGREIRSLPVLVRNKALDKT